MRKDRIVITTNVTYPWSFMTLIFCNGLPSRGTDRKTFDDVTLANRNPWFGSFLVSSNPLSRKSW